MWKETSSELTQHFKFKDFKDAVEFINQVAVMAENHNHHPTIINTYNKVELKLSTHDAGNTVTDKDWALALDIDCLDKKTIS